jgi:hypothetical protein
MGEAIGRKQSVDSDSECLVGFHNCFSCFWMVLVSLLGCRVVGRLRVLLVLPVALFMGVVGWILICIDSERGAGVRKPPRAQSHGDPGRGVPRRRVR